jgi:hypothetical protein
MISKSPFKFLDSYTLEDRNIFFNHDQEITDLYRRVFESKMQQVPKERNVIAHGLPCASKQTNTMSSAGTTCIRTGLALCLMHVIL